MVLIKKKKESPKGESEIKELARIVGIDKGEICTQITQLPFFLTSLPPFLPSLPSNNHLLINHHTQRILSSPGSHSEINILLSKCL